MSSPSTHFHRNGTEDLQTLFFFLQIFNDAWSKYPSNVCVLFCLCSRARGDSMVTTNNTFPFRACDMQCVRLHFNATVVAYQLIFIHLKTTEFICYSFNQKPFEQFSGIFQYENPWKAFTSALLSCCCCCCTFFRSSEWSVILIANFTALYAYEREYWILFHFNSHSFVVYFLEARSRQV